MPRGEIDLKSYMGLAIIVAINLAVFRNLPGLLTIPAIAIFVILFDFALARLLIWRRPLSVRDGAFVATAYVVNIVASPFGNDPLLLRGLFDRLPVGWTGKPTLRFVNSIGFIYLDRAVLCGLILAFAWNCRGPIEKVWRRRFPRGSSTDPLPTRET
ncbi:hypothetical protein P12x_003815 [Tundrisphaera lichenicola]|uniref:hypothetical protein n=1 Tax=Tundrisphaera lichenicola TaxID=2029860 RepID=UPI003EBD04E9